MWFLPLVGLYVRLVSSFSRFSSTSPIVLFIHWLYSVLWSSCSIFAWPALFPTRSVSFCSSRLVILCSFLYTTANFPVSLLSSFVMAFNFCIFVSQVWRQNETTFCLSVYVACISPDSTTALFCLVAEFFYFLPAAVGASTSTSPLHSGPSWFSKATGVICPVVCLEKLMDFLDLNLGPLPAIFLVFRSDLQLVQAS